jgi:hypothetical protein
MLRSSVFGSGEVLFAQATAAESLCFSRCLTLHGDATATRPLPGNIAGIRRGCNLDSLELKLFITSGSNQIKSLFLALKRFSSK